MEFAQRGRNTDSDSQKLGHLQWMTKTLTQRLAARVIQHQHRPAIMADQIKRKNCPIGVKSGPERVFMLEPPKGALRRPLQNRCHNKDMAGVSLPLPAV